MYKKTYHLENSKFDVEIHKKNIKNMYLRIGADNKVRLSAPLTIDEITIDQFIESKMEWIKEHYHAFDEFNVFLLGKSYPVVYNKTSFDKVIIIDDEIVVNYQKEKRKQALLQEFLMKRLDGILDNFTKIYHVKMNIQSKHTYEIKKMRSRWGANFVDKRHIKYNSALIHKHIDFIEYVVVHELSHFMYQNHSKEFYEYVSKYMPDYKVKRKL